jgi:hypothetical protein
MGASCCTTLGVQQGHASRFNDVKPYH